VVVEAYKKEKGVSTRISQILEEGKEKRRTSKAKEENEGK
jgi:hypothetical protein